jgi:hypothetical protein
MDRPLHYLIALVAVSLISTQSFAKGSNMRSEDRYDPQHIENLPPEVQREVLRLCATPRALHSFATYTNHLQKIVLHFEHLYCGAKPFCDPSGCLHQTYISSGGGHYRLLQSY